MLTVVHDVADAASVIDIDETTETLLIVKKEVVVGLGEGDSVLLLLKPDVETIESDGDSDTVIKN